MVNWKIVDIYVYILHHTQIGQNAHTEYAQPNIYMYIYIHVIHVERSSYMQKHVERYSYIASYV